MKKNEKVDNHLENAKIVR